MLRHERQTVAMALAEASHHSAPKGVRETYSGPRAQKTASAQVDPTCFDLFDSEDVGGVRPDLLHGVRQQERDSQRTVKQIIAPSVDSLVLHMVEQLVGAAVWEPLAQWALTGKDDEAELFSKRATLFRFRTNGWKQRKG